MAIKLSRKLESKGYKPEKGNWASEEAKKYLCDPSGFELVISGSDRHYQTDWAKTFGIR